jgi:glycosyltransferase involved in cell wall biosynthesis
MSTAVESSLIIITLNRAAALRQTLQALVRQHKALDEVIVVDNGPDAETEQTVCSFADSLPVRYVAEPKRGYGAARNRGLHEARGRVLYFLDDDCVAEPDWSEVLWDALAAGKADLACGSRARGRNGLAARLEYLSTDGPVLSPRLPAGAAMHLSTSNLILWRRVADEVGAFDETLVMCEDRDFTTRARNRGFRLWYEPRARVTHYPPVLRVSQYLGKMRHYGFGTSQYFARWRGQEKLGRVFPRSPAGRLLLLPALALAGAAYLVVRNLPQCPDAAPLAPLLFLGQLWWHWGGFEAARRERAKPC